MTPEKDQFREKWGEIMNSKKHHKFAAGISFLILFALMIVPVPANAGTSDNDPASGSAPVEARTIPDNRFGQVTGQGDELTPEKKKAIVKRVATEFRDKYVFAGMGEKMANYIERQEVQGIYDSLAAVKPFCAKLTSDLREISKDKHLFVFQSPEEAKEVAARNNLPPPEEIVRINESYLKGERRGNFGFGKIEILEGNVGYVDIDWFSSEDEACEKVIGLMSYLSDTEAIIFDLRDNGGGGGNAGSLLMSYFFDGEKVPFAGVYWRSTNQTEQSWSAAYVPGKRLPDVDVYILTNSKTFSAAEDFCYSLQALRRAVIVGERTKGGAHPVDVVIIDGDILAQISIGNSVHPLTGSNWETNGVIPDIEAASENSLQVAYRKALEQILEKTSDPEDKEEIRTILTKQK